MDEIKNRFTRYSAPLLDALRSTDPVFHPAIEEKFNEHVAIQSRRITFAAVDLSGPAASIRAGVRTVLLGEGRYL